MTPLESNRDEYLVALLIRGDERALTLLYDSYYKVLFQVAKSHLPDVDEADEIVQELFITIWYRRSRLNMKPPLLRYLLKSVQNRIRNALRNHYHRSLRMRSLEGGQRHERVLHGEWADSAMHVIEIQQSVVYAKERMKPHVRKIFELRVEYGKSHAEIAEELNVSVKAVEKSLTIARKIAKTLFLRRGWPKL